MKGCKVSVEMNKRIFCSSCKGSKAEKGSKPRRCFECGGRGSIEGNYGIRKKCLKCDGAGVIVKVACGTCDGVGVLRETVTEEIELPQGVGHD